MIYVLGSINTDVVAVVERLPKPGETMAAIKSYTGQGGKGANQAIAVSRLGGSAAMIGAVGSDAFGAQARENLISCGVDATRVKTVPGSTGIAFITVENGENRIIYDAGANSLVWRSDVDAALAGAGKGDALLAQLEIPVDIVEYAFETAKRKGMLTVLNPAPAVKDLPAGLLKNADIVVPNETETEILSGVMPTGDVELALAIKHLRLNGANDIVITLGDRGSAVCTGQTITYVQPRKVEAVDTTCAGDTFVGAMLLRLMRGDELLSAARFASVASSIAVTREGAAVSIPSEDEVLDVIEKEKNEKVRNAFALLPGKQVQ